MADDPGRGSPPPRLPRSVLVLLVVCTFIEALLWLGDLALPGAASPRGVAVALASFRPDVLGVVQPVYPGQQAAMFLTYSLLHGGQFHLAVNMLTLVTLGTSVARASGEAYFCLLYLAATVAGAAVYALIGPAHIPMVGASGALFGLAGALVGWEIAAARSARRSLAPSGRLIALLVVLNVVLWWAAEGQLAWQAHLGGALAGLAIGTARPPGRKRSA